MLSHALHGTLVTAASSLIGAALQHGKPPSIFAPSDEPSAVAAVAWAGVPDVVANWRHCASALGNLQVHSVFTHGSPKVDFYDHLGTQTQCELADLLLVIDELGSTGAVVDRRAVLVQAKLFNSSGKFTISGGARNQLELLRHWHKFTFVTKSVYGTASRDFCALGQPGRAAESGCYGGIGGVAAAPLPFEWLNIAPNSVPAMLRSGGVDLAEFLAGMATGKSGVGREAIAHGTDDWSSTVDALLTHSAPQNARLSSSLGPSRWHPRGVTSLTLTADELQHLVGPSDGGGPAGPEPDRIERGNDWGISFIRIIVGP